MEITYKGIGISINPPVYVLDKDDQRTIIYNLYNGTVYGGSEPKRKVKHVIRTHGPRSHGFYPGCTYKMELDLMNRSLVMECNGERIIIDSKIGDFDFSPIIMFGNNNVSVPITLL